MTPPGSTHHHGLSRRSHAHTLKQPAISASAAPMYRSDVFIPCSVHQSKAPPHLHFLLAPQRFNDRSLDERPKQRDRDDTAGHDHDREAQGRGFTTIMQGLP